MPRLFKKNFIFIGKQEVSQWLIPERKHVFQSEIEGYHSVPDRTVYLHLRSLLDTHTLVNQYESFVENRERKDFLSIWAHMRDKCARALLVLFHISHIIIVTNPGHTFDYSYIHLFRALEIVRCV